MQIPTSIMLIDDDVDDRDLFFEALMEVNPSCGFMAAVNGKDGLEKLQKAGAKLPHLIFLDINMPIMNGMQFLHKMRMEKKLESIPVIIYSTKTLYEDMETFKSFGSVYFLTKPVRYKQMVKSISFLLSGKWWQEETIKKERLILVK